MSLSGIHPLRCDWPLPGEYLKAQGDPLAMDLELSSIASRQRELVAILTDPAVQRGDHLSEEERREHERCTKSIVDAAVWFR